MGRNMRKVKDGLGLRADLAVYEKDSQKEGDILISIFCRFINYKD